MRKRMGWIAGMFLLGAMPLSVHAADAAAGDSLRTQVENGKIFVLHKVDAGENLTKIANRYKVTITQIQECNAMSGTGVQLGQVLKIPRGNAADAPVGGTQRLHIVAKGETLFAIARQYGVKVEEIQSWNGLADGNLTVGQKLKIMGGSTQAAHTPAETSPQQIRRPEQATADPMASLTLPAQTTQPEAAGSARPEFHIVKQGESLWAISRQYGIEVTELKRMNRMESDAVTEGQRLVLSQGLATEVPAQPAVPRESLLTAISQASPADTVSAAHLENEIIAAPAAVRAPANAKTEAYTDRNNGKHYLRVEERGAAGAIEDFSTDQTRFYAFHKTLPAGTYLRVDCPARKQSILVEVIGTLPESDPNAIRLTARCRDYLLMKKPGEEVVLRYVLPQ